MIARVSPRFSALLLVVLAVGACEDDPWPVDGQGMAGAPGAVDVERGWARPAPLGMAIVSSDRKSASVSLAALGGTAVTSESCFGSGSADPQLSAALSGDVVLPSETQPGNELVVIDRSNGVLTWLDPTTCQVRRQLNVGSDFSSNPYDLAGGLGGPKGYVTRYNRNAKNPEEGSDILVIDTQRATPTGRIDLRSFVSPSDTPGKTIVPFPTRMSVVGQKVYVALNNLSEAYDAAGVGRVLEIDALTDQVVASIDLPPLKNCGVVKRVASTTPTLAVGCSGAYSDNDKQIEGAGVAVLDLSQTPVAVKIIPAQPFGRPVSGFDLAVLESGEAFTVVSGVPGGAGGAMGSNDAVWAFGLGGGAPAKIFEGGGAYVLSLALDRTRRTLYLLEAAAMNPRVHVLSVPAGAPPTMVGSFVASPKTGLPPRQLAFY